MIPRSPGSRRWECKKRFNKDRLYVALYARGGTSSMPGGEDKYHWALLLGPKKEVGTSHGYRYHAKETMTVNNDRGESLWEFEERDVRMSPTLSILVRVMVGKVSRKRRLKSILRGIPMRPEQQGWNCVSWVKEALEDLQNDGAVLDGSSMEWVKVRDTLMQYIQEKASAHRFDGQAPEGQFDQQKVPTFDMVLGRETIP